MVDVFPKENRLTHMFDVIYTLKGGEKYFLRGMGEMTWVYVDGKRMMKHQHVFGDFRGLFSKIQAVVEQEAKAAK